MEGKKWIHRQELKKRWNKSDMDLNKLIFKGLPVYKGNYEEWTYRNPHATLTIVLDPNSTQFHNASYFDLNDIKNYEEENKIVLLQTSTKKDKSHYSPENIQKLRDSGYGNGRIAIEMQEYGFTLVQIGRALGIGNDLNAGQRDALKQRTRRLIEEQKSKDS